MGKFQDLTGQKFNRLTVIKYLGHQKWLCKCICGNNCTVISQNLVTGHTKSCGCLQKEIASKTWSENGKKYQKLATIKAAIKNRKYKSLPYDDNQKRISGIWSFMIRRCEDKNNKRYGKRGIKVCREWYSFENFYNWAVNNGYQNNLTIDRINNDGNYEPSNCRWITIEEQQRNKSNNCLITYNNKTCCIKEWSEITGISFKKLYYRYKTNKNIDDMFKEYKEV